MALCSVNSNSTQKAVALCSVFTKKKHHRQHTRKEISSSSQSSLVVASAQFSILITGNKTKASQAVVHHRHHREQFIIGTFGGRGRRAPGPGKERSMGSRKERHEVTGGRAPGAPRRRSGTRRGTTAAHEHQGHHGGAHVHQGHHSSARAPARG